MPRYWTPKNERQYKHIEASCLARDGRRTRVCKRIAAATVNKQRSLEGLITPFPLPVELLGIGAFLWAARRIPKS